MIKKSYMFEWLQYVFSAKIEEAISKHFMVIVLLWGMILYQLFQSTITNKDKIK